MRTPSVVGFSVPSLIIQTKREKGYRKLKIIFKRRVLLIWGKYTILYIV